MEQLEFPYPIGPWPRDKERQARWDAYAEACKLKEAKLAAAKCTQDFINHPANDGDYSYWPGNRT